MINGAHVTIESADGEADRAFLRDVIGFRGVDVGGGWLILALPPSEVAIHPASENGSHKLCDEVEAEVQRVRDQGVDCDPITEVRWGRLTALRLPGGGKLALYQPKHARPPNMQRA
jgi:hypothetical protein